MPKPRNNGKEWTPGDVKKLTAGARKGDPTKQLARELGRTPAAIRMKASRVGVSLEPKDK